MEIGIKVMSENPRTREERHVVSCYFTMVAVDDAQIPIPIEPLDLQTPIEKQLFEAAKKRKQLRDDYQKAHEATRIGDLPRQANAAQHPSPEKLARKKAA
jgi:hypothetical protein